MKTSLTITTTILLSGLALVSSSVMADGHCERAPQTFKLKIKLKNNKPTQVLHKGRNAEDFNVCLGDSIQWQVSGFGRKDFYINFEGGNPTPGGANRSSNNGKVLVTIGGGAQAGKIYKYSIGVVGGGEWDPRVIVDR